MGVYSIMDIFSADQKNKKFNEELESDEKNAEYNAETLESNDREEGEIVDDFELILSSEDDGEENEEFTVRERIKQLEATNNELEQIARISGNQFYGYNYYSSLNTHKFPSYQNFERNVHVVSDASSISSGDFLIPKKKKRHKIKRNKGTDCSSNSKNFGNSNRRNYNNHRKERKRWRNSEKRQNMQLETILINSNESLSDEDGNYRFNCKRVKGNADQQSVTKGISRAELRFALAHDQKHRVAPIGSLKERLAPKNNLLSTKNHENVQTSTLNLSHQLTRNEYSNEVTVVDSESEVDSLEESELRLIALKSAVLKKHYLRKMRNAEAYSPTDFIECGQKLENVAEIEAIDDVMEISPAESPIPIPSPHFEETSVNTRPIDMDIVMSDSDDENKNIYNCISPPPELNLSLTLLSSLPQSVYVSEISCDTNQMRTRRDDETPPPPPPFFIQEDEKEKYNYNGYTDTLNKQCNSIDPDTQTISMENSQDSQVFDENKQETSDEEEKALRALLLSKCNTSTRTIQTNNNPIQRTFECTIPSISEHSLQLLNCQQTPSQVIQQSLILHDLEAEHIKGSELYTNQSESVKNNFKENRSKSCLEIDHTRKIFAKNAESNSNTIYKSVEDDEDTEQLRSLLLNSMSRQKNKSPRTQSPVVLKEAVRRFQNKFYDNSSNSTRNDYLELEFNNKNKSTKQINNIETKAVENELKSKNNIQLLTNHSNIKSGFKQPMLRTLEVLSEANFNKQNEVQQITLNTSGDSILTNSSNQSLNSTLVSGKSLGDKIVNLPEENKLNFMHTMQSNLKNVLPLNTINISTSGLSDAKTQPIKIVKPNKIINKNLEVKRKLVDFPKYQQPKKKPRSSLCSELSVLGDKFVPSTKSFGGRLVTKAEISNYKVSKLIIAISNSESETDDYNDFSNDNSVSENLSSIFDPIAKNYGDNASPMSLAMESPCETPPRSNTPTMETSTSTLRKSILSEYFEKKLDDFLKQHRSQVQKLVEPEKINISKTINKKNTEDDEIAQATNSCILRNNFTKMSTPLAVRHLSAASQAEYQRLIQRMELLEKRKALRIRSETLNKLPIKTKHESSLTKTIEQNCTDITPNILQNVDQIDNKTISLSSPKKRVNVTVTADVARDTMHRGQMSSPNSKWLAKSSEIIEIRSVNDKINATKNLINLSVTNSTEKQTNNLSGSNVKSIHVTNEKITHSDQLTTESLEKVAGLFPKISNYHASSVNDKTQESIIPAVSLATKPDGNTILKYPTINLKYKNSITQQLYTLESSYLQIGADMISHLNTSLLMVKQAKLSKIARLRHCQRLKELYVQIAKEKRKIKIEQTKISKIQPKIHSSHATVIEQKKQRKKMYEAAMDLGRSVYGNEYRLNDEAKVEITRKANQLMREIRLVNSLINYNDLIKVGPFNFNKRPLSHNIIENIENMHEKKNVKANVSFVSLTKTPANNNHPIVAVESKFTINQEGVSKSGGKEKPLSKNIIIENDEIISKTSQTPSKSNEDRNKIDEQQIQTLAELMPKSDIEVIANSIDKFLKQTHVDGLNLSTMSPEKLTTHNKATTTKNPTSRRMTKIFEDLQNKTEYTEANMRVLTEPLCREQKNSFQEYISPLACIKELKSCVNSKVVCPYDLMGDCEDKDCPFLHLNNAKCV